MEGAEGQRFKLRVLGVLAWHEGIPSKARPCPLALHRRRYYAIKEGRLGGSGNELLTQQLELRPVLPA